MSKRETNISFYTKNKEGGYIHMHTNVHVYTLSSYEENAQMTKIFINKTKKTLRSETPAFEYIY